MKVKKETIYLYNFRLSLFKKEKKKELKAITVWLIIIIIINKDTFLQIKKYILIEHKVNNLQKKNNNNIKWYLDFKRKMKTKSFTQLIYKL